MSQEQPQQETHLLGNIPEEESVLGFSRPPAEDMDSDSDWENPDEHGGAFDVFNEFNDEN